MPARARTLAASAAAVAALSLFAGPAVAHVVADPDEVSGPSVRTALRVSHGCEGAPTTALRVQIPEGATSVAAEAIPGWDVEVVRESAVSDDIVPAANREVAHEGEEGEAEPAAGRIVEVSWRNGSLPDGQFQEFGLSFQIAEDAPEVLWFPTIQECEEGQYRWIDIPATLDGWGDLAEPAPYVVVASDAEEPVAAQPADGAVARPEAPEAEPEPAAEAAAPAGEARVDPLAATALAVGVVGLALGAGALLRTRSGA